MVARENFGLKVAQIAAVALLIDYTLTVAVQTSAGAAALTAPFPSLANTTDTVAITVGVVLLLAYGNLRGIREAGSYFAVPTYFFILPLALAHRRRLRQGGARHLHAHPAPAPERRSTAGRSARRARAADGAGLHLAAAVLRQRRLGADRARGHLQRGEQSSGPPSPRNARITLVIMSIDPGLPRPRRHRCWPRWTHAVPYAIGHADGGVPGGQVRLRHQARSGTSLLRWSSWRPCSSSTLAANTSFNGLPLPGQLRGRATRYLPRQLTRRGHRLVFSNGILVLTVRRPGARARLPRHRSTAWSRSTPSACSPASPWPGAGMVKHHLDAPGGALAARRSSSTGLGRSCRSSSCSSSPWRSSTRAPG